MPKLLRILLILNALAALLILWQIFRNGPEAYRAAKCRLPHVGETLIAKNPHGTLYCEYHQPLTHSKGII